MLRTASLVRQIAAAVLALSIGLRTLADAVAPGIVFALGVARLGGFLQAVWADQHAAGLVPQTALASLPVHPLRLYLAAWSLGVAAIVLALRRRTVYPGELALACVALHEVGRGWLEFLRAPGPEPALQAMSFAAAAVAGALLVAGRRARLRAGSSPRSGRSWRGSVSRA